MTIVGVSFPTLTRTLVATVGDPADRLGTRMTIDALHGKARRSRSTAAEALAIGEADANIFDCPQCRRPLGVGTRRCPGCGTRLLSKVRAGTVLGYAFGGLLIGLLIGGGTTAAAMTLASAPATVILQNPGATALPHASAAPVATGAPVEVPGIPTAALSALGQSANVNLRLAADADRLTAALRARNPSSSDLARILRSLSSNASFGERLPASLTTWGDARAYASGLAAFYERVGASARDGLAASLSNERAYTAAAKRTLKMLGTLTALDRQAQDLAATAGISVPSLATPAP